MNQPKEEAGNIRDQLQAQLNNLAKAPVQKKKKKTMTLLDQIRNKKNKKLKKVDVAALKKKRAAAAAKEKAAKQKATGRADIMDILKARRKALESDEEDSGSDSDWDD